MTQTVKVELPHRLGKAEAQRRIRDGFPRFEQQMSALGLRQTQSAWAGDTLSFSGAMMGQSVGARIDVQESLVRIEVDLPDLLAALANTITGRLRSQGRLLLEPPRDQRGAGS
ncbi:MAG: polyhydroxyalkanoic acid system family protein [Hyphomonadaceae bacterium]